MKISIRIWNCIQILLLLQYFANCNYSSETQETRQEIIEKKTSIDAMYIGDYIKYYNYPVETHLVQTIDGYILKIFRIQ